MRLLKMTASFSKGRKMFLNGGNFHLDPNSILHSTSELKAVELNTYAG